MKVKIYRLHRVRKYLRKRYNFSDNELTTYLVMKYHLDHYPTREEIIKLERFIIVWSELSNILLLILLSFKKFEWRVENDIWTIEILDFEIAK